MGGLRPTPGGPRPLLRTRATVGEAVARVPYLSGVMAMTRRPETIRADLTRLHHQRADAQTKLSELLTTIDAITEVMDAKIDELARALDQ